jgi:Zn-dependent protease
VLLVFNLIPIPPLDGSKLLFAILDSPKYDNFKNKLESRGPMILLGFMLLDSFLRIGILNRLFSAIISLVYSFF